MLTVMKGHHLIRSAGGVEAHYLWSLEIVCWWFDTRSAFNMAGLTDVSRRPGTMTPEAVPMVSRIQAGEICGYLIRFVGMTLIAGSIDVILGIMVTGDTARSQCRHMGMGAVGKINRRIDIAQQPQ
jgi:hypothetical protein